MTPRLKSLEMHGFKTFASRINFEFPGVITAIVGPNGSGKSNIADAIRWVLGEQSYTLLRGRKTEDMIFAGSEQRPRAGMAFATITFDNSDGWLPIDYSEVAITRRAYRDGQNEYLLNGQRVRLKEISELLAQSGLAERTYTIIGQGLVDAALSLKPEERRRFFEEAAGIGLYRSRREESLNRLEATKRNLERVHDIVNELEPRLQSLEKQAKRAIEYERVKADLRVLLRDWYGYHWHRVIQDIAHSQEVARVHEARQQNARVKLMDLENQLNDKLKALAGARNQLNDWHAQAAEKHREREKISRDLAVIDERQRVYASQSLSLDNDRVKLEEEQGNRQIGLNNLEEELSLLTGELEEAKKQADSTRAQLIERQTARENLEISLKQERKMMLEVDMRLIQLKAKSDELSHRRETLNHSKQDLNAILTQTETKLLEQNQHLDQTQMNLHNHELTVKGLEQQFAAQRDILRDKENDHQALGDKIAKLITEKTRIETQLDILEQADRSNIGLNRGARYILETFRSGKLPGQYKALSSLIQVPYEYEIAVAAVLGESLDAVIYEPNTNLEEAFTLLELGEKGRTILFPTTLRGAVEREEVFSDPDYIGVVADLIKAPIEIQKLVNQIFDNVLLVRNRATAQRLSHRISTTSRLVTLKGEVFWGNGAISAGQEGRSGVIARPRQRMEFESSNRRLSDEVKSGEVQREQLEKEIEELRKNQQKTELARQQANQDLNRIRQAKQHADLEIEQTKQRLEWLRSQITDINKREKITNDEQINQAKEIHQLEIQLTEIDESIRQRNRSLNELPVDEIHRQVNHWETNVAVFTRAVKESERRLEERKLAFQAGEAQNRIVNERIDALNDLQNQSNAEKLNFHLQENIINVSIQELSRLISPAEQELDLLEGEYSHMQGDYLASQQAATLADRLNTQAQLDLTRNREAMDAFRRRIEDDFGLVVLDYSAEVSGQTPLPFEGIVEQLPVVKELSPEFEESISRQRSILRRMGAVNQEAQHEFKEVKDRYEFLKNQIDDLKKADADLRQVIVELDELMQREFLKTFEAVAIEFKKNFNRLFGGGTAQLVLSDEEHPVEGGVDIEARLPGRREQGLSLLSGGERSLTAVALIFSLIKVSPTPFCVMDEVDAMLDEANVGRFRDLLLELSRETQFIIITHNRNTVQSADVIYGVTMGRDSASQVISLKVDEVSEELTR